MPATGPVRFGPSGATADAPGCCRIELGRWSAPMWGVSPSLWSNPVSGQIWDLRSPGKTCHRQTRSIGKGISLGWPLDWLRAFTPIFRDQRGDQRGRRDLSRRSPVAAVLFLGRCLRALFLGRVLGSDYRARSWQPSRPPWPPASAASYRAALAVGRRALSMIRSDIGVLHLPELPVEGCHRLNRCPRCRPSM